MAIELPPGARLSDTERVTEEIARLVRNRPEVTNVFVDGGRSPQGTREVRRATVIINYTPKNKRSITQTELELYISQKLNDIPDIRYWFLNDQGLRAISIVLTGANGQAVANVANELATQMRRIPLLNNVVADTALNRPELRILPRLDVAVRLGVSTEKLSESIRVATIGDVEPALARFDTGDRQVPVRVQLTEAARADLQRIEQMRVPMGGGGNVPLSAVADIKMGQGPTVITRYDRDRQAIVAADLSGDAALGDAMKIITELPVMKNMPKGVRNLPSGDAESLAELADGFKNAMSAGLMMVYAVLVLLFSSFLQPITILFSLPLSIGGAVGALLVTGKQLTTPVYIGMLMLMGIVTKNAIMLVDFAIASIHEGKERDAAIVDAGQKRARPIIMTTIAMVAGMMPSALSFGAGGEFRAPMALAVIGGLVFSTFLSLVFVPAMFALMDDLGALMWRIGRRVIGPVDEEAPAGESAEAKPAAH
jgi:multidrug efflux pump subunit AcrB